jgi:dTDP-glucose 4,6-dehydratase
MSRKMLVTGGAGFIGSNLALYALQNFTDELTIYDGMKYAANPKTIEFLISSGARFVQGDLLDETLLSAEVDAADIIVHFAAESHNDNSIADPRPFLDSNVIGTFNLLEAVRKHQKQLHHVSTDEVFGDLELDDPQRFTESTPYNPSSPYSATKAASDMLVRAWVRTYGVRATLSNCSNNFGPYQHVEKFIPRQITNVLKGVKPKLYGTGKNVRDWIHVDVHSEAVMTIIDRGVLGETYLIGADGERSNHDVMQAILSLMGKPADWFDFVGDRKGHDLRYAIDSSKIRSELSWTPKDRSFEEDLAHTIDWYRENADWWEVSKIDAETRYRAMGQV